MKDSPRKEILNKIAQAIGEVELPHPARVGIDGLSASGKTVFADELAGVLQEDGKKVIRAGLDGAGPAVRGAGGQRRAALVVGRDVRGARSGRLEFAAGLADRAGRAGDAAKPGLGCGGVAAVLTLRRNTAPESATSRVPD